MAIFVLVFHFFQRYLKRFEYANAKTEDLWEVLGEVSIDTSFNLCIGFFLKKTKVSVTDITWLNKILILDTNVN